MNLDKNKHKKTKKKKLIDIHSFIYLNNYYFLKHKINIISILNSNNRNFSLFLPLIFLVFF